MTKPSPEPKGLYIIDDAHRKTRLSRCLGPVNPDFILWVNADHEPTTEQVDRVVAELQTRDIPDIIVGIGGGTVLDITKAVSVMLKNPGSSAEYQGWDLVKYPGVCKIGVPTISGTGAEASRTAVLLGPEKKFGINSDHSMFDAILLDPDLLKTVPKEQCFYTGMDCYIHCVEALAGRFINTLGRGYADKALEYCTNYFLSDKKNDEELMVASFYGGCSIVNSEVGVCHALSYGLTLTRGLHHGEANCIAFNQLEEFYPDEVAVFKKMLKLNNITLRTNVLAEVTSDDMLKMVRMTQRMEKPLTNALGENWRSILTEDKIAALYNKM